MSIWKYLFGPSLVESEGEKAENEEQKWYDDYIDWCNYDQETNQCTSSKVLISEDAIIVKLFNMFNELLAINKGVVIKYNKPKTFGTLYTSKIADGSYCITEDIAKHFITNIVRDDWDTYLHINGIYEKYRFKEQNNIYYIPLDVFVYGFSKYNDLMKIVSFDHQPIPDMPLPSKKEPALNVPVQARKYHNVNTNNNRNELPEVKIFGLYLKKSPQKKNEFLIEASNKLERYWKSLQGKQKKTLRNVSNNPNIPIKAIPNVNQQEK